MSDNPGLVIEPGNPDPNVVAAPVAPVTPAAPAAPTFSWKNQLPADFANAPTMQKFEDTKEGFGKAVQSHLLLEKLLGHEKVPVPKGPDDSAAWDIFSKAMRIPEKADGYGLPDVEIPESMKGLSFDKKQFAELALKNKLTPEAAKGLWESYTTTSKQAYANAMKAHEDKMTGLMNQLRGEWGDAYQSKVKLGEMVINKFSDNQEMNDEITATLVKSANGIKFLAKIGEQFSENKIGDFKYQRHALTPEEAQGEMDSIRRDSNHPYNNERANPAERDRAIEHMNALMGVVARARG